MASTTVEPAGGEPLAGDEVQDVEGVAVADWSFSSSATSAAAEVGRQDLGRQEVRARERGLARAGGADEHDQATARESSSSFIAANTAICVGGADLGVVGADAAGTRRA